MAPFKPAVTARQQLYNTAMSQLRISVEHGCGRLTNLWSFTGVKRQQRSLSSAVRGILSCDGAVRQFENMHGWRQSNQRYVFDCWNVMHYDRACICWSSELATVQFAIVEMKCVMPERVSLVDVSSGYLVSERTGCSLFQMNV